MRGTHDDGIEGHVDPAARLEPVWEEAAMAQLWDGQGQVPHLGGEQPPAVAVAMGGALIGATLAGLMQRVSQAPWPGLPAWGEVGGIASSLCLKPLLPQPIST
jgi:hypothetical protein